MRKPLIFLLSIASLQIAGCSSSKEQDNAPNESFLERIPIVHRQDIQQGNIVTQEMNNRLQPGMSKSQDRFVMGTPMLVDAFHQNRWDYPYEMTRGWGETERKRLTLIFEADQLVRMEGDYHPQPEGEAEVVDKETVVSVPDYVDPDEGIFSKDTVSSVWKDDGPDPRGSSDETISADQAADAAELQKATESLDTK